MISYIIALFYRFRLYRIERLTSKEYISEKRITEAELKVVNVIRDTVEDNDNQDTVEDNGIFDRYDLEDTRIYYVGIDYDSTTVAYSINGTNLKDLFSGESITDIMTGIESRPLAFNVDLDFDIAEVDGGKFIFEVINGTKTLVFDASKTSPWDINDVTQSKISSSAPTITTLGVEEITTAKAEYTEADTVDEIVYAKVDYFREIYIIKVSRNEICSLVKCEFSRYLKIRSLLTRRRHRKDKEVSFLITIG